MMASNSANSGNGYSRDRRTKNKSLTVATHTANTTLPNGAAGYAPQSARSQLLNGLRTAPRQQPHTAPFYHSAGAGDFYAVLAAQNSQYYQQMQMQMQMQMQGMVPDYEAADVDGDYSAQLQATEAFLLQRQQALQNQIMQLTAQQFGGLSLAGQQQQQQHQHQQQQQQQQQHHHNPYAAAAMVNPTAQTSIYAQQLQNGVSPIPQEVPGQPGLYLVYNPMTGQHTYAYDPTVHQQVGATLPPNAIPLGVVSTSAQNSQVGSDMASPQIDASSYSNSGSGRGHSPSKNAGTSSSRQVSPPNGNRPSLKTSSRPSQTSTREVSPPARLNRMSTANSAKSSKSAPATDTKGKFLVPFRQPYNPPPIADIRAAPDATVEACKNFSSMRRGEVLKRLVSVGINRRTAGQSGTPTVSTPTVTVADYGFGADSDSDSTVSGGLRSLKTGNFGPLGSFTNPASMVLVPGSQFP